MEKLVAIFNNLMSSDNQTQIIFGQKCVDYITSKTVADAPIAWFPTSGFLKSNNFVLFLNSVYNVQVRCKITSFSVAVIGKAEFCSKVHFYIMCAPLENEWKILRKYTLLLLLQEKISVETFFCFCCYFSCLATHVAKKFNAFLKIFS